MANIGSSKIKDTYQGLLHASGGHITLGDGSTGALSYNGPITIGSTLTASQANISNFTDPSLTRSGLGLGTASLSSESFLLNRVNHTGAQSADTITDGTINKAFLATERAKLARLPADPIPFATDIDKQTSDVTPGTDVVIIGEGGRIEQFVDTPDPTRFFTSGAPLFSFEDENEDTYTDIDLNGFGEVNAPETYIWNLNGDGVSYIIGAPGSWAWYLGMNTDPILYTSTDNVLFPSQVTNWVPNPLYPEIPPAPTFTPFDNSGFTFPMEAMASLSDTPPVAVPIQRQGGRMVYSDDGFPNSPNWSCYYDTAGSEGEGWYFSGDDYVYYSDSNANYPWEVEDWDLVSTPVDPATASMVVTRMPTANQAKWAVKRNTVYLLVGDQSYVFDTELLSVNGVVIDSVETVAVGWVDPSSLLFLDSANRSFGIDVIAAPGINYPQPPAEIYTYTQTPMSFPVPLPLRCPFVEMYVSAFES
jgi:hypothetical protein